MEAGRRHAMIPLSGITHRPIDPAAAEAMLEIEVEFLHRALDTAERIRPREVRRLRPRPLSRFATDGDQSSRLALPSIGAVSGMPMAAGSSAGCPAS